MKHIYSNLLTMVIVLLTGLAGSTAVAQDITQARKETRARVTGIGGVFFLSSASETELSKWYETHLGMRLEDWGGAILQWKNDTAEDGGVTVWGTAQADSDWFAPSSAPFMINYRVNNMAQMIKQLTDGGVEILEGPEYAENGVFLWIMDPAGNKIELWEPKLWDDKNKK